MLSDADGVSREGGGGAHGARGDGVDNSVDSRNDVGHFFVSGGLLRVSSTYISGGQRGARLLHGKHGNRLDAGYGIELRLELEFVLGMDFR